MPVLKYQPEITPVLAFLVCMLHPFDYLLSIKNVMSICDIFNYEQIAVITGCICNTVEI